MRRRGGYPGANVQQARGARKQIALVLERKTVAGRPAVTCRDPLSLDQWFDVPVSVRGGGPDSFAYFPPSIPEIDPIPSNPVGTTAAQAVLDIPQEMQAPRCDAMVPHPAMGMLDGVPLDSLPLTDRANAIYESDAVVRHGGTTVSVAIDGSVTVDVKGATMPMVRVQLPAEGVLRVSRAGEATDRLVLASELVAYLTALEARVNALDAAMQTAGATGIYPVSGGSVTVPPVSSYAPGPAPDAALWPLAAAAIHVSSIAEVTP